MLGSTLSAVARLRFVLLLIVMGMTFAGCDVNGYVLGGSGADRDGGGDGDGGGGGGGDDDGGNGDGDGGSECIPITEDVDSTCDDVDDDCDGMVDEDTDTDNDPSNCGGCGNVCDRDNASGECVSGGCVYTCEDGFFDFNGDLNDPGSSNGCEDSCNQVVTDDQNLDNDCDFTDEDCDRLFDEDANLDTDPANCGMCGRLCFSLNAVGGGACAAGDCIRGTCKAGFLDCDNEDTPGEFNCDPELVLGIDGCEYACPGYDEMNPPSPGETLCDGLDEDCDGRIDEDFKTGPEALGSACSNELLGECQRDGVYICAGDGDGTTCNAPTVAGTAEICDGLDNDCDGNVDLTGTDPPAITQLDPDNCGACGVVCDDDVNIQHAASTRCNLGTCEYAECATGFFDTDLDRTNGCENECTPTAGSIEICDGVDNDCDDLIDDDDNNTTIGTAFINTPNVICEGSLGPCAGTPAAKCGIPGGTDLENLSSCTNKSVTDTAWYCNYDIAGGVEVDLSTCRKVTQEGQVASDTSCDTEDNDCDGDIDELFPEVANFGEVDGDDCQTGTTGICQGSGNYVCNGSGNGITCDDSADPPQPARADELCNGKDDDCDDKVDESAEDEMEQVTFTPIGANCDGSTGNGLGDACIDVTGRSGFCQTIGSPGDCGYWIDKYEASRPNSTNTDKGTDPSGDALTDPFLACSMGPGGPGGLEADELGRIPWSNISLADAELACTNAGKRLCTEDEWEYACAGAAGNTYPYGDDYDELTCNGSDWNPDCYPPGLDEYAQVEHSGYGYSPGSAVDNSGGTSCDIAPTSSCISDFGVVDMSGNVREWTATDDGNGNYKVRGGSYTEPQQGITCQNNFLTLDEDTTLPNLGFRCCRDTSP